MTDALLPLVAGTATPFVADAASAAALAVVAVYGVALGLVSLLGVQAGLLALAARRHRAPDLTPLDEADLPRVTVQVPLFDEPAVAARIVRACLALDYPAHLLDVQILDDSRDATPALVAAELAEHAARIADRSTGDGAPTDGPGVAHIRRADRVGFKAGALAHGLRQSTSDVVAIFDADFVPAPDTLRRLVPILVRDAGVGCVQARWGHLNADASWLTRAQAMGLDLHFAVEHRGRSALGGFFNFNGTAGLWRRACIDDAGGWRADSLAEDLDLSYRAQLAGWRFACADAVAVPAELPATLAAWRTQQRRWAKGGAEVLRLLGPRVARAPLPVRVRTLGLAHIGASLALLATATVVLLHAPAWLLGLPAPIVHAGTVGALGYLAAVTATAARRRAASGGFARAIARAPLFLAAMAGLAPSLAASVIAGLRGRATPFERTEKVGDELGTTDGGRRTTDEALAAMGGGRQTTSDAIPSQVSAPSRFPAPGRLGATGDGSTEEAVWTAEPRGTDRQAPALHPLSTNNPRQTTNARRPRGPSRATRPSHSTSPSGGRCSCTRTSTTHSSSRRSRSQASSASPSTAPPTPAAPAPPPLSRRRRPPRQRRAVP